MNYSIEDQVHHEKVLAKIIYEDGRRAGELTGHQRGYDEGYLHGFDEGIRSAVAYKAGERFGWQAGYIDRISDEQAQNLKREAA